MDTVIQINPVNEHSCIICSKSEDTVLYSGSCACNPVIHIACLENWYQVHQRVCPKCRKIYAIRKAPDGCGECMSFFCCMIVVIVFILAAVGKLN